MELAPQTLLGSSSTRYEISPGGTLRPRRLIRESAHKTAAGWRDTGASEATRLAAVGIPAGPSWPTLEENKGILTHGSLSLWVNGARSLGGATKGISLCTPLGARACDNVTAMLGLLHH